MENIIIWKSIKEIQPNEGQQILYSYSYEYSADKWERRVLIGDYTNSEKRKYPMCYMTHWTELPEPVIDEED